MQTSDPKIIRYPDRLRKCFVCMNQRITYAFCRVCEVNHQICIWCRDDIKYKLLKESGSFETSKCLVCRRPNGTYMNRLWLDYEVARQSEIVHIIDFLGLIANKFEISENVSIRLQELRQEMQGYRMNEIDIKDQYQTEIVKQALNPIGKTNNLQQMKQSEITVISEQLLNYLEQRRTMFHKVEKEQEERFNAREGSLLIAKVIQ